MNLTVESCHHPHRNLGILDQTLNDGDDVGEAVVFDDLARGGGHLRRGLDRVNVARPGLDKNNFESHPQKVRF